MQVFQGKWRIQTVLSRDTVPIRRLYVLVWFADLSATSCRFLTPLPAVFQRSSRNHHHTVSILDTMNPVLVLCLYPYELQSKRRLLLHIYSTVRERYGLRVFFGRVTWGFFTPCYPPTPDPSPSTLLTPLTRRVSKIPCLALRHFRVAVGTLETFSRRALGIKEPDGTFAFVSMRSRAMRPVYGAAAVLLLV